MKRFTNKDGFTLIELLIVIIIIGILAAIAIPMFLGQRDKAKESAVKANVHNIYTGVVSWSTDNNDTYPPDTAELATPLASYLDSWPKNPWTNSAALTLKTATAAKGNMQYTNNTTSIQLIGLGKSATGIITLP